MYLGVVVMVLVAAISVFISSMFIGIVKPALSEGTAQIAVVDGETIPDGERELSEGAAQIAVVDGETIPDGERELSEGKKRVNLMPHLQPSIISAMVFLLHLSYLCLVAWDQIFRQSKSDVGKTDLILPILLCVTYSVPTGMMFGGAGESYIKLVSLGCFVGVYLAWGCIDWHELRRHEGDEHESSTWALRKRLWMALDVAIAMILFSAIGLYLIGEKQLVELKIFSLITIKEIVILITILAYFLVSWIVKKAAKSTEVLSHKLWQDTIETTSGKQPHLRLPAKTNIRLANERKKLKVLVVNCGTGRRTSQLLEMLGLKRDQVELIGYNHDPRAEGFGPLRNDTFTSKREEAIEQAKVADIAIVLHSTYDREEMRRAESVIRETRPGTVVLARGFADHSLLATVCFQIVDRGLLETPSYHHWADWYLKELVEDLHLEPIDLENSSEPDDPEPDGRQIVNQLYRVESAWHIERKPEIPVPCALIRQHFVVSPFTIACVHDYLSRQFSPERADMLQKQLKAVLRSSTRNQRMAKEVNADDYVYAFVMGDKGNPPPPRPPRGGFSAPPPGLDPSDLERMPESSGVDDPLSGVRSRTNETTQVDGEPDAPAHQR